jgi:integrase
MRERKPFQLYERGGVWYARFWDEQEHRYSVTRSTECSDRDKAVVAATRMIEEGSVKPRSADPYVIAFCLDYWRTTPKNITAKYRSENINLLEKSIEQFPGFKRLRLSRVRRFHLVRLREWIEHSSGIGARSGQRAFQAVTVPLAHAFATGLVGQDLTSRLEKPSYELRPLGALTLPEIKKIIDLTPRDPRQKAVMLLGCLAGLRRGEMRALVWRSVDFEKHEINVENNFTDVDGFHAPKSYSTRRVGMIEELEDAIKALRVRRKLLDPDDFVLANAYSPGAPMSATAIDHAFKNVLEAIGIDAKARKKRHLTPHSMRHSFVSLSRTTGLSDFAVMALSGHRSADMMRRYSDATTVDRDDARRKIQKAINES